MKVTYTLFVFRGGTVSRKDSWWESQGEWFRSIDRENWSKWFFNHYPIAQKAIKRYKNETSV
jgi:hypothetical protein